MSSNSRRAIHYIHDYSAFCSPNHLRNTAKMKSMQRGVGKFMKRSENEADVSSVIADFKAVDDMLERVSIISNSTSRTSLTRKQLVKDIKAWRDAWQDLLKFQYDTSEAFVSLYRPIDATGEVGNRQHRDELTPAPQMQKCLGLQKEYSDEKTDLAQEIALITNKVLLPAEDAKQRTKLLHKTLKHRENTKLDYERYVSRVEHARKKEARSAKDEQNLQTHEANLAQSKIDYSTADDHVRQTFPSVTAAVLSLLPYLLDQQVRLQTTLVGQLYTVLDAYTKQFGFPNPAPSDAEIVRNWDQDFTGFRKELEQGISLVAKGKAVHMSLNLPPEKDKSTVTGLGLRNKVMQKKETKPTGLPVNTIRPSASSNQLAIDAAPSEEEAPPPKPPRPGGLPSPAIAAPPALNTAIKPRLSSAPSAMMGNGTHYDSGRPPPPYDYKPTALIPGYSNEPQSAGGAGTPPSRYQTPANGVSPLLSPQNTLSPVPTNTSDYFNNQRRPSANSVASVGSMGAAAAAAAKKKPPPPVPAKRMPSFQAQFVTALYDFEGQNPGDLAFREGDRIKVVKKTDSVDDWWDGELRGVVGAFPANYVQL